MASIYNNVYYIITVNNVRNKNEKKKLEREKKRERKKKFRFLFKFHIYLSNIGNIIGTSKPTMVIYSSNNNIIVIRKIYT